MVKIDKRLARKVFKAGKDIVAIPYKMNPPKQSVLEQFTI